MLIVMLNVDHVHYFVQLFYYFQIRVHYFYRLSICFDAYFNHFSNIDLYLFENCTQISFKKTNEIELFVVTFALC